MLKRWLPTIKGFSSKPFSKDIALRTEEEREERSDLEDQLRKAREEVTDLEERRSSVEEDIRKLSEQNNQLRDSLRRESEEKSKLQEKLLRQGKEKGDLQASLRRTQGEYASLKQRSEAQENEIKGTKNELLHLTAQRDDIHALLETRTRELKGAQAFLTKADVLSGAEVIGMVEGLNSEIMQTAAFITDSFDFDREQADKAVMVEASSRVNESLGSVMAHLLTTVRHSEDPMLIQIALQASMTALSVWMAGSWDFDVLQAEQPLPSVSLLIIISVIESQAVAGRWRALTRAHAQRIGHKENDVPAALVAHLSDMLVEVLLASGCTGTFEQTYRAFTMKFGERLLTLVRLALRLNKAMGEEVTSADLALIHCSPAQLFDPAFVEDAYGEDEADNRGEDRVLCTTDLGLRRVEKVSKDGKAEIQETILRKPKVALESIAESMEKEDDDA